MPFMVHAPRLVKQESTTLNPGSHPAIVTTVAAVLNDEIVEFETYSKISGKLMVAMPAETWTLRSIKCQHRDHTWYALVINDKFWGLGGPTDAPAYEPQPEVAQNNVFGAVVCVPEDWTKEQAEDFMLFGPWHYKREEPCPTKVGCKHVVLEA